MIQGHDRLCNGCGQKLPVGSKLSEQTLSTDEATLYGSPATPNPDGTVTIDLCLQCRVTRANQLKHGY